ncbi:MAG: hypothetical protein CVU06_11980, partial [Bacteroidetes bacterium HGW-Bacteroidetes-22]
APVAEGWIEISPSRGLDWPVDGKLALRAIPAGETTGLLTLSSDSNAIILAGLSDVNTFPDAGLLWSSPDDDSRSVNGYQIYRDGVLLNSSPVADTFYIDIPGFDLIHYYTVSAIHGGNCESAMSNEVQSDITIGQQEEDGACLFTVGPNPANQYAEIAWHIAKEDKGRLSLITALGNEVFFTELGHSSGRLKLNTSTISSGVYLLRLKTSTGTTLIRKLTIAR